MKQSMTVRDLIDLAMRARDLYWVGKPTEAQIRELTEAQNTLALYMDTRVGVELTAQA